MRPHCKRCGSPLSPRGWCSDETCPFHDWPQSVELRVLRNGKGDPALKRPDTTEEK
jgi:hypothetical protein